MSNLMNKRMRKENEACYNTLCYSWKCKFLGETLIMKEESGSFMGEKINNRRSKES